MSDARMNKARKAVKELGYELVNLSRSIGRDMTPEDRYYVSVKLRARIEQLMQLHDMVLEGHKQPGQTQYSNPEQHPF